jgi:hypothetical protein
LVCFPATHGAEAAIAARKGKPGFVAHPDGFLIAEEVVDRDQEWLDGFFSPA